MEPSMPKSAACRQTNPAPEPAALQPVIGGTLLLLSHYAQAPDLAAAERIAHHLALIARHPDASDGLQHICTQLFATWVGPVRLQDVSPDRQWRDVWPMPPAVQ
jgi:hypothetical protein